MNSLRTLIRSGMVCGVMAALLGGLCPAIATAQSVHGTGVNFYSHGAVDGANWFQQVAVNAWLDADGGAHGTITWEGLVFQSLPDGNVGSGGPADPFIIEVTDIKFDGNTATVGGIVIAASVRYVIGTSAEFIFTDNSGTGQPDEINSVPIDAGKIIVKD